MLMPWRMRLYVFMPSEPQNGGLPVRISNIRIPRDQKSADRS